MVFRFYCAVLVWSGLVVTFEAIALVHPAKANIIHSADFPPPSFARQLLLGQGSPVVEPEPPGVTEEKVEEPAEVNNEETGVTKGWGSVFELL